MGLFDEILGTVVKAASAAPGANAGQDPLGSLLHNLSGGQGQGGGKLLGAAVAMLQQAGGLDGVVDAFRKSGLGQQADSWVGTGANLGINADQLRQVLGEGAVGQMAKQLGMNEGQAGASLAQLLPELVNQLTPRGQVPAGSGELLGQLLKTLQTPR